MTSDAEFEACVLAFEQAWRSGMPPAISDFLPAAKDLRTRLLIELTCLDLEHRWRKAAENGTRAHFLEEYSGLAELGLLAELPAELIAEEYRVRHRWGDRPARSEFVRRFGSRVDMLGLLDQVNVELRAEAAGKTSTAVFSTSVMQVSYSDIRLRRMIGAGGFGKVYIADRTGCSQPVAVKFLRRSFWRRPEAVERFLEEVELVARLRHRGIVPVHEFGVTPAGGAFFVMDLVEGQNLASVLRSGHVSVEDAIRWTVEACHAVGHAHEQSIVHCDLKPSNLLLGLDGHIRVTDFGLARRPKSEATGIGGTDGYMAPEQLDPRLGSISPATDIYGLGAVLWTLLTGKAPGTELACDERKDSSIRSSLIATCQQCLSGQPDRRFANTNSLATALEPFRSSAAE